MNTKKKIIVPLRKIAIEKNGCHLAVDAVINGKAAVLILDSGASQSVFDQQRMKVFAKGVKQEKIKTLSSGLGTSSMKSHIMKISSLRLGELLLRNRIFVLLDLSHVNQSYAAMAMDEIDGVIGGDLLQQFNAVIDYGKCRMVLNKK